MNNEKPEGFIQKIVERFLDAKLSIIFVIAALCLGIMSIAVTPREEEPQIVVPMADLYIQAPGATAGEIEKLVVSPLERFLWQIDGVEYVYSMSGNGYGIVTVRFYVGEDRERSILKLNSKVSMNIDKVSPIVKGWVIKPVEIDDVPIVNLTLYSDRYDDHELFRIAQEILPRLSEVENVSRTDISGGRKREIRLEIDPEKMHGSGVSIMDIRQALTGADASVTAGNFDRNNLEFNVTANSFISSAEEVKKLTAGTRNGRPVKLEDLGEVLDVPEEQRSYTRICFPKGSEINQKLGTDDLSFPAVTLAVAKKKGTNAVKVADDTLNKIAQLKQDVIPDGVYIETSRNYGATAKRKVDDLLTSLLFAIVTVVILLALTLGWREALVVALAVPISFSLALFVNQMFGFTINRVTLFALILSLGLVVDDPITNVDNIQRHILTGKRSPRGATLFAVNEVLPPVLMSTIAIIICFVPLFFITGMMGPYMAPMAVNVPLTVVFSTLCAITVVPWFTHFLLSKTKQKVKTQKDGKQHGFIARIYRFMLNPFLKHKWMRYLLTVVIIILLILSCLLAVFRQVPLKLLPFDNKNEFQVIVDMPEGTTLETTDSVIYELECYILGIPEVTSIISHAGIPYPMDFNGMVRHYYLKEGSNSGELRVNMIDKSMRDQSSHEIVLRIRKGIDEIAHKYQANLKIVEIPPGPPVLSTIVGEVYKKEGTSPEEHLKGAEFIRDIMAEEPFVVDIDIMAESYHEKYDFILDKEKAALHGISTQQVTLSLKTALSGITPVMAHVENERDPLMVRVVMPRNKRASINTLSNIPVKTMQGKLMSIGELVTIHKIPVERSIYHKNLKPVIYVMAETAGRAPAEAILDMQKKLKSMDMPKGTSVSWSGEGEWKITIRVFRDMGIAFAAALLGIYILLVVQSGSFFMPVLIMMAIPLTLLGIMPGFFLLNLVSSGDVGGFSNPVFFTATSMIGMIALGGIVIRNSLVLIEFIQDAVKQGETFKEAILKSGAIRMRPILLTAATTAMGSIPITFDPVFSGLAWALIFGLTASTFFTLIVIPVTYYALYKKNYPEAH